MDSFMARGNQYIQMVKVLYCKLMTIRPQMTSEVGGECVTTAPPRSLDL